MNRNRINEDKLPQKLNVGFSPNITNIIDNIEFYNRNNIEGLCQWYGYLKGMVSYISNPVIAWDNMCRYQKSSNGKTHLTELGYNITFRIKVNKNTNQSYVYIFDMNFNTEEFGLEQPSMYENKHRSTCNHKKVVHITESELYSMVQECVNRIVRV